MSAATEAIPGAGMEGGTQGTGGGELTTQATVDSSAQASSSGDPGSQDYLGRIRAGGDFAASEVTKHQSRADKMEAEVRRLAETSGGDSEALNTLRQQGLTPDMIAAAATNYFVLRANPQTQESVLGLERTGVVPERGSSNSSDVEDEYLTDEQREIRALRAELQQVRQDTAGLTQSTGSAALQSHLERFARENFLNQEEFEGVKQGMLMQAKQWSQNDAGLKLLRDLQNPGAYETVDAVAWKFVPKQVRLELGERKRLQDQKKVRGFRTDVPTDTSTTGREPPPEFKSTEEALKFARANPDRI